MDRKMLMICVVTAVGLCTQIVSFAVVLHPDGEPNLSEWTDRPQANVVGRWSSNASCVAISANTIITTRHQGGGVGTSVWFGGVEYTVEEIIYQPDDVDLRLCRVKRKIPGLTCLEYVPLYVWGDERGKYIVVGGYGKARGNPVSDEIGDGYSWTGDNQTQRWGTNRISFISYCESISINDAYTSDTIKSTFDPCGDTAYEAAMAIYDSGGGWFIKDNYSDTWSLAAVSAYVEFKPYSYYNPSGRQWGIRISSYADWIEDNIFPCLDGDYSGDYKVDFVDFAILASNWQKSQCPEDDNCEGADYQLDGDMDFDDLAVFLDNWLYQEE